MSWEEAMSSPLKQEWLAAAQIRFNELKENKVFTLVDRPKNKRVIKVKPVFKTKFNPDGSLDRRTMRIAAKRYTQIAGIDFNKVFSPVASYESIRICLALAAILDFEVIDGIDYTAAFIQAPLEEEVYVEQPPGMSDGTDKVWRLWRALEGLHQSGRTWYININ
jgi:Reverse transcriptase (RNA-dependent DNA polymerase)